jgi:hypothetical protein
MSLREKIVVYLESTLKEIAEPRPVWVTREHFDAEKLAITQFPAVLVSFATEDRETVTMGASGQGFRQGIIEFSLRCFVRGQELDRQRNTLIEAIEEHLDKDRNLGLRAEGVMDSQITSIEVIDRLPPLAEVLLTFTVNYRYNRGLT